MSDIKSLDRKLWTIFSKYIRASEADENGFVSCITCTKKDHWKEMDAGHFVSRRHQATKFDEKNVNPQCKSCNRFHAGEQFRHGVAIDKKYGEGTAESLDFKSRMMCKRTRHDYLYLIDVYKEKLKKLGIK